MNGRAWTAAEKRRLRQLYPDNSLRELAPRFPGRTLTAIQTRATYVLKLHKSASYRAALKREIAVLGAPYRFKKGLVPANKGLRRPGWHRGRMRETQFQKGGRPHSWLPVGTVRMNADGYLVRKVAESKAPGQSRFGWEHVHRRVWEDAHGTIPKGQRIWWKDRDHTNNALENLEILSGAEHMARTTIHNLPPALKEVMHLKGAIRRVITRRKKHDQQEQAIGPARSSVRNARAAQE